MCVICQTTFETGVLTVCGHQFCKACMMMWFRAHRNCPVCKRHLEVSQLHDITMKPQELQVRHEDVDRGEQEMSPTGTRRTSGMAKKTMIYSAFDSQQLAEIKNIELDGPSYTTKVDTLVRHLLWLRENDPGAKSIVFSQ
jgi:E3 ubiquitin-protein ligase SHPRH